MNDPFLKLLTVVLFFCAAPAVTGEDAQAQSPKFPKSISVKTAIAIIGKTEVAGQGCGGSPWNGKNWACFLSMYKPMKLPWYAEPQKRVQAVFVFGEGETHLIEFSGPGFCYKRSKDVPDLTFEAPSK